MAVLKRALAIVLLALCATPLWAQTVAEDAPTRNGMLLMPIGMKRCDTATSSSGTDGDLTIPCVDSSGRLWVSVGNGSLTDANGIAMATLMATATATGAATECPIISAASTNATNCKGTPGNLYGYELYNTTTTLFYLRLYNSSGAPTCSSATGFIKSIPIPPAGAAGQVGGVIMRPAIPVAYSTGISFCITAGSSSTDNTNAAVGILGVVVYK